MAYPRRSIEEKTIALRIHIRFKSCAGGASKSAALSRPLLDCRFAHARRKSGIIIGGELLSIQQADVNFLSPCHTSCSCALLSLALGSLPPRASSHLPSSGYPSALVALSWLSRPLHKRNWASDNEMMTRTPTASLFVCPSQCARIASLIHDPFKLKPLFQPS